MKIDTAQLVWSLCVLATGAIGGRSIQKIHDMKLVEEAISSSLGACESQRNIDKAAFVTVEQRVADRCQREIDKLGESCNSLLRQSSQQSITIEGDSGSWNPCHMGQVGCP